MHSQIYWACAWKSVMSTKNVWLNKCFSNLAILYGLCILYSCFLYWPLQCCVQGLRKHDPSWGSSEAAYTVTRICVFMLWTDSIHPMLPKWHFYLSRYIMRQLFQLISNRQTTILIIFFFFFFSKNKLLKQNKIRAKFKKNERLNKVSSPSIIDFTARRSRQYSRYFKANLQLQQKKVPQRFLFFLSYILH